MSFSGALVLDRFDPAFQSLFSMFHVEPSSHRHSRISLAMFHVEHSLRPVPLPYSINFRKKFSTALANLNSREFSRENR